jgi:hypothetical protein
MQNYNQRDDMSRKREYQVTLVGCVWGKAGLDALERISFSSRWTNHNSTLVQPHPCHYTDWAIAASMLLVPSN